jgi:hypothetical protein
MSEYHVVEVVFKDENILKQSLKDMGYAVEVHKEPITIKGYVGKQVGSAHLVVRNSQFGGYGDVGFERTSKGFTMHADSDDIRLHHGRFKIGTLNTKYMENKLKKYVNTTSTCNVFSRKENENGQVEIHLRIT